jgi:galactokinase
MAIVPTEILNEFGRHFGWDAPPVIYRAPGRVNLIGEHTDYNLGYVLPVALEMACYVATAPSGDGVLRIRSQDLDAEFSIAVSELLHAQPQDAWHDYVIGVAQQLVKAGIDLSGSNLLIRSEVPTGSGLSSSAALEIGTAFALLNGRSMDPLDIATLGQRAETQFVGVPVGIMDQYASVFGRENAAIQIDCRSLGHEYVTLPSDVSVIAVNSLVKHELGSSAYRDRVAECKAAVEALQATDPNIKSLRDVTLDVFVKVQETVPPIPRQRARHVISDSQRVLDFAKAAAANDLTEMGRLLVASHRSMQYDYEISCEEIDFLVDAAIKIPGVYGARMTGGGFGGCTVNLVQPDAVPRFRDQLTALYSQKYNLKPVFYNCKPANGAGLYYR